MRPNWASAPEWANYAAQEQSGTWYWHEMKPRYQELTGEWISKGQRQIVPKVTVQAKDTMEQRPTSDRAVQDCLDNMHTLGQERLKNARLIPNAQQE